ncbi:MAG TPA: glycosyl hydrolase 53 family protein, partial [Prevotella sp.]
MNIKKTGITVLLALTLTGAHAQKYVGGDISLLPKYEQNGSKYLTHGGSAIVSLLPYCRQEGMNAMRLRLFAEPANASQTDKGQGVCQDLAYTVALGRRIKEAGMKLLLDLHYSDSWADPSKQWTPKAWLTLTDARLNAKIYTYTKEVLQQMKAGGAEPDLIQTGNEISYGMLWGAEGSTANRCYMGSETNWARFSNLLAQAAKACREVCPQAKIVLHTERIAQTDVLQNFYRMMQQAGADYDIIGLSYYPSFHGNMARLEQALTVLETNFADKPIMIVETGYPLKWPVPGTTYDYTDTYPYSDEGQRHFAADLVALLNRHKAVNGLFWWWLEANEYGHTGAGQVTSSWYNAPLFDNETGRATSAFYELKNFRTASTGISAITKNAKIDDHA